MINELANTLLDPFLAIVIGNAYQAASYPEIECDDTHRFSKTLSLLHSE